MSSPFESGELEAERPSSALLRRTLRDALARVRTKTAELADERQAARIAQTLPAKATQMARQAFALEESDDDPRGDDGADRPGDPGER